MKSNHSNSVFSWLSPLESLFRKGLTLDAGKLSDAGIKKIADLLWILPNKIYLAPQTAAFTDIAVGRPFKGIGKVLRYQTRPSFGAKGRYKIPLQNITLYIQDVYSVENLELVWFNCYPSVSKKLKDCDHIAFQGKPRLYKEHLQIANPSYEKIETVDIPPYGGHVQEQRELVIHYPAFNTVTGKKIKNIIDRVPKHMWYEIKDTLPDEVTAKRKLLPLDEAFRIVHGKSEEWSEAALKEAQGRLVYQELFQEQVRLFLRKEKNSRSKSIRLVIDDEEFKILKDTLPYRLTIDQNQVLDHIREDLSSPGLMMRLLQGDVGCGKTAVALLSALIACKNGYQSALMCPTESLAYQHFLHISELLGQKPYKVALILGSTPAREKTAIREKLGSGDINLIIGTHALIQDAVVFHKLAIAIIDEQHKFGVNQRLRLLNKNEGVHCLIMTATPIPRSLRLTQYGDLDISTIKEMPQGRKGYKTKIVTPQKYGQFLSFIKTRLSMGEQGYVVVPAIEESENLDMENIERTFAQYSKFFCEYRTEYIHGRVKAYEKQKIFEDFSKGKVDLLISTSVIEVGINVVNATVMAILDAERFGLSSLHQLRGRIGRGSKMGFCFLVTKMPKNSDSFKRLKIIEQYHDGFIIAEEDLKNRGEGDLFGVHQSGEGTGKVVANIILHQDQLLQAKEDIEQLARHLYTISSLCSQYDQNYILDTV